MVARAGLPERTAYGRSLPSVTLAARRTKSAIRCGLQTASYYRMHRCRGTPRSPARQAHLYPHLFRKRLVITQPSLVSSVQGLRATRGRQASLGPNPALRRVSQGLETTQQTKRSTRPPSGFTPVDRWFDHSSRSEVKSGRAFVDRFRRIASIVAVSRVVAL